MKLVANLSPALRAPVMELASRAKRADAIRRAQLAPGRLGSLYPSAACVYLYQSPCRGSEAVHHCPGKLVNEG